jgi:hypothetical protein
MALCEVLARDPRYAIDVVSTIEKLDEQGFTHKVVVRGFELETDERIFAPKGVRPLAPSKISGRFAGIYRFREGHGNGAKRRSSSPYLHAERRRPCPRCGSTSRSAKLRPSVSVPEISNCRRRPTYPPTRGSGRRRLWPRCAASTPGSGIADPLAKLDDRLDLRPEVKQARITSF